MKRCVAESKERIALVGDEGCKRDMFLRGQYGLAANGTECSSEDNDCHLMVT